MEVVKCSWRSRTQLQEAGRHSEAAAQYGGPKFAKIEVEQVELRTATDYGRQVDAWQVPGSLCGVDSGNIPAHYSGDSDSGEAKSSAGGPAARRPDRPDPGPFQSFPRAESFPAAMIVTSAHRPSPASAQPASAGGRVSREAAAGRSWPWPRPPRPPLLGLHVTAPAAGPRGCTWWQWRAGWRSGGVARPLAAVGAAA